MSDGDHSWLDVCVCVCVCVCAGVLIIMCAHTLFPHNYTPTAQQSEDYYGI